MEERPFSMVPISIIGTLAIAFGLQFALHTVIPKPQASVEALTPPPSLPWIKVASLGEPVTMAKWLMLRLQTFDNQPGVSIPFKDLNYSNVILWLDHILALDPHVQYPLLSASRLYAEIPDPQKQRQMLHFIEQKFLEDPNRRWPWLAHASIIARHRLNDLPLAQRYAHLLKKHATGGNVPHWATQMEALIAADMNETEKAKILLGGLLESGQVTDSHEFHFLKERLNSLQQHKP